MEAGRIASDLLAGAGSGLAHSAAVAGQAGRGGGGPWGAVQIDSAWLHDNGSVPVAAGRSHPLDRDRWLRDRDRPDETCRLVAGHSRSRTEVVPRELEGKLPAELPPVAELPAAALARADLEADVTAVQGLRSTASAGVVQ